MRRRIPKKYIKQVIEHVKNGKTVHEACGIVGIATSTFYDYIAKNEDLKELYYAARYTATGFVEDALFVAALSGNVTAQIFWLKNRGAGRWSDKFDVSETVKIIIDKDLVPSDD